MLPPRPLRTSVTTGETAANRARVRQSAASATTVPAIAAAEAMTATTNAAGEAGTMPNAAAAKANVHASCAQPMSPSASARALTRRNRPMRRLRSRSPKPAPSSASPRSASDEHENSANITAMPAALAPSSVPPTERSSTSTDAAPSWNASATVARTTSRTASPTPGSGDSERIATRGRAPVNAPSRSMNASARPSGTSASEVHAWIRPCGAATMVRTKRSASALPAGAVTTTSNDTPDGESR